MVFGLFKSKPKMVKVKKKTKAQKPKVKKKAPAVKTKKSVVKKVGRITHYFPHVKAGVILVANEKITLGDRLHIKGHTTDFKQKVASMQVNNAPIKTAVPGQEVGLLLKSRVRHNDVVYKIK